MSISELVLPYPDFQLGDMINPDEFDLNNQEVVNKVNAISAVLNQITDAITDGTSGADAISLTAITPFISTKLQAFLEEVISKLQSTTIGASGAGFVASEVITGVTGSTVLAQLQSLKSLIDTNATNLTNHKNTVVLDHPDSSVTQAKLAIDSVSTPKIVNLAVTTAKLADLNVTTGKIADLNVTLGKLAPNSVDASKIVDGSVGTSELADASVTTIKHADSSVTLSKLATNSVDSNKLIDGSVITSKIADLNITTGKIADASITLAKMSPNSIDATKITDNSIGTAKLVDLNVTNAKIADQAVTSNKIANKAITAAQIADNTITSAQIVGGTLDGRYYTQAIVDQKIANAGATANVASGTVFPTGSFTEGQLFWRSDLKEMYTWSSSAGTWIKITQGHNDDVTAHNSILVEDVDTSTWDATNKVYTTVNYKRSNNTLFMRSVLSNLTSGKYLTDTWTYYNSDGTTPSGKVVTWSLVYDASGNITNKTPVVTG